MRTSIVKIMFYVVCAILIVQDVFATTWTVTKWNYSPNDKDKDKKKAFSYAVNNAKDDDIIEIGELGSGKTTLEVTSDIEIYKRVHVRSMGKGSIKTIKNIGRTYICNIHPGGHLTLSNITVDCENELRREDLFHLKPMEIKAGSNGSMVTNVARMTIGGGATIKRVYLTSTSGNENAAIHVKTGAVLRIQHGAMIQNCTNESVPGKGGAICCDFGTIIMTGGTITGCSAVGPGGAIHTDGTRVDSVEVGGISARGDIYISGGYITNNICGAGKFGGAIYLGNSGPMLHITGNPVIASNFRRGSVLGGIPDDVSTYRLQNAFANRLKLVSHSDAPAGFTTNGITFTGSVGVRYPDPSIDTGLIDPHGLRFGGMWEYFTGTDDEPRNFFWNGDSKFHGALTGNSLVWEQYTIHKLPKDEGTVAALVTNNVSPIYVQLNEDYEMKKTVNMPANMKLFVDLNGFDLKCDFHVSNDTAQVVIRDTSIMKSGTVSGHRDSEYPNAFMLEGGSYHTFPPDCWVASNRVLISNYCTNHPYMVASLAWDTINTVHMADLTKVPRPPANGDGEVRIVASASDIDKITFSTGDWVHGVAYSNLNLVAQVFAVAAVSNDTGISEFGERVKIFDTADLPAGVSGTEDRFVWPANSYGLIKLIHITKERRGENLVTKNEETAYFQFPEAAFKATQRKNGVGELPITVVDELLSSFGCNRAEGFEQSRVNGELDKEQTNGLRRWENIVTGTDENQLLLSTAAEVEGGLALNIALTETEKQGRADTGYHVRYSLNKYDNGDGGWKSVGEIKTAPEFSITLLDGENKSVGATGFYRVTTLIIPDNELSVTNEIPSTNIVGVLEVASTLTNTLAAVPWTALASDPAETAANPVTVADYLHTPHLGDGDSVEVADKGNIYRMWNWDKAGKTWSGAFTVTGDGVFPAQAADGHVLGRSSAVWVTRKNPDGKPFFLIGQYSSAPQMLTVETGTVADPVCTLVPNPSVKATKINDYGWGGMPHEKDLIRIPNGKGVPIALRWKNGKWGRYVYDPQAEKSVWTTDEAVPAGTGFWYHRCAEAFQLALPHDVVQMENRVQ